jgi:hypothetical protein
VSLSNLDAAPAASTEELAWQLRLLPLMIRMIVGLTFFFFAASLGQLVYLHSVIDRVPITNYAALSNPPADSSHATVSPEFRILASLDANLLDRRYHQANVFLMGRLWTSYLGFVTGMILALVGAIFILGKLRIDASELSASGAGASLGLKSTSPGLILAALGVVLMVTTIVTNHPIQTADSAVFVGALQGKPGASNSINTSADTAQANAELSRKPATRP